MHCCHSPDAVQLGAQRSFCLQSSFMVGSTVSGNVGVRSTGFESAGVLEHQGSSSWRAEVDSTRSGSSGRDCVAQAVSLLMVTLWVLELAALLGTTH